MTWLLLVSSVPLFLPVVCWSAGCRCDFVCPAVGLIGCAGFAAVAAAGIFVVLVFVREMAALSSLRD